MNFGCGNDLILIMLLCCCCGGGKDKCGCYDKGCGFDKCDRGCGGGCDCCDIIWILLLMNCCCGNKCCK